MVTRRLVVDETPWLGPRGVVALRLAPVGVATCLAVAVAFIGDSDLPLVLVAIGALTTAAWTCKKSEPLLLAAILCLGLAFVAAVAPQPTVERALTSIAFAAGLYLLHAMATLAVVAERNAALHRQVAIRWAWRTLAVVLIGACSGGWAFFLATRGQTASWTGYLGLAPVVLIGALPIGVWRRPIQSRRP